MNNIKIALPSLIILAFLCIFCIVHDKYMEDFSHTLQSSAKGVITCAIDEDMDGIDRYIEDIKTYTGDRRSEIFILSEHADANNIFFSFSKILAARQTGSFDEILFSANDFMTAAEFFIKKICFVLKMYYKNSGNKPLLFI